MGRVTTATNGPNSSACERHDGKPAIAVACEEVIDRRSSRARRQTVVCPFTSSSAAALSQGIADARRHGLRVLPAMGANAGRKPPTRSEEVPLAWSNKPARARTGYVNVSSHYLAGRPALATLAVNPRARGVSDPLEPPVWSAARAAGSFPNAAFPTTPRPAEVASHLSARPGFQALVRAGSGTSARRS